MSRLIDKDFILDGIKFIFKDNKELITSSVARNAMIGLVERAKTVDAESVRHGHWIKMDGYDGDEYYDCSECGMSWFLEAGTPEDNEMAYCPKCGAKLDGGGGND